MPAVLKGEESIFQNPLWLISVICLTPPQVATPFPDHWIIWELRLSRGFHVIVHLKEFWQHTWKYSFKREKNRICSYWDIHHFKGSEGNHIHTRWTLYYFCNFFFLSSTMAFEIQKTNLEEADCCMRSLGRTEGKVGLGEGADLVFIRRLKKGKLWAVSNDDVMRLPACLSIITMDTEHISVQVFWLFVFIWPVKSLLCFTAEITESSKTTYVALQLPEIMMESDAEQFSWKLPRDKQVKKSVLHLQIHTHLHVPCK